MASGGPFRIGTVRRDGAVNVEHIPITCRFRQRSLSDVARATSSANPGHIRDFFRICSEHIWRDLQ